MPPNLARMYPPVSFWNFSSAAAAAPNVATARHASAVTRSCLFVEFFFVLIEAILGRSSALGRLLKHGLQGGTRGFSAPRFFRTATPRSNRRPVFFPVSRQSWSFWTRHLPALL